jgi:class 3 adenylate cyclase
MRLEAVVAHVAAPSWCAQVILGETPNLVARLQGIAEPNNVVIAESTRKLVGSLDDGLSLDSFRVR